MIRDIKSYIQTVGSRLSNAFSLESFGTESELEFWSLAAEHFSREEPPKFIDIVRWIDLLYRAPVHIIYKREEDKMRLYRRQVLAENLTNAADTQEEGETLTDKQQKLLKEYEEQLQNVETRIPWRDEYLSVGISSHAIGKCEHIPLFHDEELWGIYCVGPQVRRPDTISAKLSIVARILSDWLVELDTREERVQHDYEAKAEKVAGDLGTGTLNLNRIANLMLSYLSRLKNVTLGAIVEQKETGFDYIAEFNVTDEFTHMLDTFFSEGITSSGLEQKFHRTDLTSDTGSRYYQFKVLEENVAKAYLILGFSEEPEEMSEKIETSIIQILGDLLLYRKQNMQISDKLIDTYYKMLRRLEKQKEKTRFHTPRLISFAEQFGKLFGLNEEELSHLSQTAKLHDIGYIVTRQLDQRMTMGAELEHPSVGSMIIDPLPVHQDVKEGIKTHHEWINGSGTPDGLKDEEIAWTGKIIGLFEFVVEFIEDHQNDSGKSDEEWLKQLTEELIERAENQFDMVLVPTAIELLRSLGWKRCCTLGT